VFVLECRILCMGLGSSFFVNKTTDKPEFRRDHSKHQVQASKDIILRFLQFQMALFQGPFVLRTLWIGDAVSQAVARLFSGFLFGHMIPNVIVFSDKRSTSLLDGLDNGINDVGLLVSRLGLEIRVQVDSDQYAETAVRNVFLPVFPSSADLQFKC